MTLAQKAEIFQNLVYPVHSRFGLVEDVNLQYFGNLSSYQKGPSANRWEAIFSLQSSNLTNCQLVDSGRLFT